MHNNNKREFAIVDFPKDKQLYGKFNANTPKDAANEVFTFLFHFMNKSNNENEFLGKFIVFTVIDLHTNKTYKYIGNRIKLKNPITKTNKNGIVHKYIYKNVIGKYKDVLDKI